MALLPTVKLPKSDPKQIEKNWDDFKTLVQSSQREGTDDLLKYLEEHTDFKTAPASGKYHMSREGGLVCHSLNVFRCMEKFINDTQLGVPESSIILVSLLHDLCKANYYDVKEVWDKDFKEETNQWRKMEIYGVEEELPLGHGEKSTYLAGKFVPLNREEACAIRWHMQAYDPGIHFFYPSGGPFRKSMEEYPLVKAIIIADQMAEFVETWKFDEESIVPYDF